MKLVAKLLTLSLVIVLASVILVACGRNNGGNAPVIDTSLELQIRQSFADKHSVSVETVSVEVYFGTYEGTSVVLMASTEFIPGDIVTTVTISEINFVFPTANVFIAWREGSFYSVQQAYDNDFLTRSQLQTIRNIHQN